MMYGSRLHYVSACLFAFVFVVFFSFAAAAQTDTASEGGQWIQLFNGKDLNDWTIKFRGEKAGVNYNDTFRVEDGLLKVCYDKYDTFNGNFGHIFYKDSFSHYRLRVEYRFVGEQAKNGPAMLSQ